MSKPTIGKPHPAHRRVGKQKQGEDLAIARKPRNLVSEGLVDRVGAFRTTTPTSTKFVLQLVLPLYN